MKVLIFGYSENSERYSNMADKLLTDYQHEVIRVTPREEKDIAKLAEDFHTLTLYVNPELSTKFQMKLLATKAQRVIFNPGTENLDLMDAFKKKGVEVVVGCTLVMLKTGQF